MTRLYYTIFNLIAFSLIIYTGVDIFYTIARARVSQVKTNDIEAQQIPDTEQSEKSPLSNFQTITDRNLFGSLEKDLEVIMPEEIEDIEPTSLRVKLLGTVSGDRQNARAVIAEKRGRKQGLYKIGDSIQDAVIKTILRNKVILRVGDKDELLTMEEPSSSKETKGSPFSRQSRRDTSLRLPRKSTRGVSTIVVNASDIQESLEDIDNILSDARIQPHFQDGKTNGLKLSRIKRGSIFSKLGLRNGDIIHEINNESLNSPDDIISLYGDLISGNHVSLNITRRGRQKTLKYILR